MKQSLIYRLSITLILTIVSVSAMSAADRFFIDATYIEPGESRNLEFNLDNEIPYYGFQADIKLPHGLEIVYEGDAPVVSLSQRANASYTLVTNPVNSDTIRIGAFSTTHTAITGITGVLVYLKVQADNEFVGGTISITDIHFVGSSDKDVSFPDFSLNIRNHANNQCYLPDFSIAVGQTKTVSLILDNETPFSALQTDIILPEGMSIVADSFRLGTRASNHRVSAKSFNNGRTRLVCFSDDNSLFSGSEGPILEFDVRAVRDIEENCAIELRNQLCSTDNADEFILPDSTASVSVNGTYVSEITLNPSALRLNVSESLILYAQVLPSDATEKSLNWSTSDETIATVDQDGYVTAISVGEATITASATDGSGISATCDVEVIQPVTSISLSERELTLKTYSEFTLTAILEPVDATDKSLSWESSDKTVAEVSDSGVVSTYGEGNAVITVSTLDGSNLSDECYVTVKKDITGVNSVSFNDIDVDIVGSKIIVKGLPSGVHARIFDLNGMILKSVIGNGETIYMDEAPQAAYILQVGNISLKLAIP